MPKKILIIDDDPIQIEIFSNGLKKHNYPVISNLTGTNVPEQIELEKPDIVLLDILLPSVSGLVIAEYLQEKPFPFIFISSSDDQNILQQAYTRGALGFLLKPVNINQLIVEIETALHWHSERTQLNNRKENINTSIENNRKISVAIGIVMERYNTSGSEAFESVRSAARSKQCKILDISKRLIEEHEKTLATSPNSGGLNPVDTDKKGLSADQILNKILQTINV